MARTALICQLCNTKFISNLRQGTNRTEQCGMCVDSGSGGGGGGGVVSSSLTTDIVVGTTTTTDAAAAAATTTTAKNEIIEVPPVSTERDPKRIRISSDSFHPRPRRQQQHHRHHHSRGSEEADEGDDRSSGGGDDDDDEDEDDSHIGSIFGGCSSDEDMTLAALAETVTRCREMAHDGSASKPIEIHDDPVETSNDRTTKQPDSPIDGECDTSHREEEEGEKTKVSIMTDMKTPIAVDDGDDDHHGHGHGPDDTSAPNDRRDNIDESSAATIGIADPYDVCIVCGRSLAKLSCFQARVNHMKRCSKKNGFSARHVRVDDDGNDDESFVVFGQGHNPNSHPASFPPDKNTFLSSSNATKNIAAAAAAVPPPAAAAASVMRKNPYDPRNRRSDKWHGDAGRHVVQEEAGKESTSAMSSSDFFLPIAAATTTMNEGDAKITKKNNHNKQTSMTEFFRAPVRSLNSVLLAGARRVATTAGIAAVQKKASSSPPPMKNQRTRGARGSFYKRKRNLSDSPCPAYKRIPGTDFVCDGFVYARSSLTQNYFLTHFHSDHYGGITKSWDAGVIYCSLPTANLVCQQLGVDKKYLHPLPMDTPTVIASSKKGGGTKPVTVTLLDANHCPGAVMFLFEIGGTGGGDGRSPHRRILHVGDFRWNRDYMLGRHAPLRALARVESRLDELFLDTTYCDERYALPSQDETIRATIDAIEWEIDHGTDAAVVASGSCDAAAAAAPGGDRRRRGGGGGNAAAGAGILFLFGAYTIGKERIYLSAAQHLNEKVYVSKNRYRILSALGWSKERMAFFTTNPDESILWVVPLGHINFKKMAMHYAGAGGGGANYNNKGVSHKRRFNRVVGFRPTGWSMSANNNNNHRGNGNNSKREIVSRTTRGNLTVYGVPYSEHSSFPELVDCLDVLKPKRIIPTVSVSKSQEQIDLLIGALRTKRERASMILPPPRCSTTTTTTVVDQEKGCGPETGTKTHNTSRQI